MTRKRGVPGPAGPGVPQAGQDPAGTAPEQASPAGAPIRTSLPWGTQDQASLPGTAPVRTSGLAKRYRKVCALSDCTVTVPEGRISALIGSNGAGKTTLLRLLAGLAAPTAGEVTVNGTRPRQDPGFLAGIGFLAQEIPLYRRLSAEDHIRAGAHLRAAPGRGHVTLHWESRCPARPAT